jgi:hypothetical protein
MRDDPRLTLLTETSDPTLALELAQRLDGATVVLRVATEAAPLGLTLANLLARLVPKVVFEAARTVVTVPLYGTGPLHAVGHALVEAVRSSAPIGGGGNLILDVGAGLPGADLYVSADAWSLTLAPRPHAVLIGVGPAITAAAALAAGEVMRRLLPELPGVRLSDQGIDWNLIDYGLRRSTVSRPPEYVDAVCFGAGSVGSSLAFALLVGGAHGSLEIVDPDRLQRRNKLRYPLWIGGASGSKVKWVERQAAGSGLRVRGHDRSAASFIADQEVPLRLAISAVDSAPARRDIADALAHTTLNAGVDALRLHVSRHRFADGWACVYCPYLDAGNPIDEAGMYQEMTGLPAARVARLLGGDALSVTDLEILAERGKVTRDAIDDLVGGRLVDLARVHLYAAAAVRPGTGLLAVSAPHVSALAGAILAAEAQKPPGERLERRVDVDLSGFPTGFVSRPLQDQTGRCLCHSTFRGQVYSDTWGQSD